MARSCAACVHPQSKLIDERLTSKTTTVSDLSHEMNISTQSLYRHQREHLSQTVLRELRLNRSTSTTDLLQALSEALDDVQAVRSAALLHGQSSMLLRAAASTQSLATTLLDRLAPDGDIHTIRLLREGERLARAIGAAVREDPAIAPGIAYQLRVIEEHEAADQLIRLADIASSAKKEIS